MATVNVSPNILRWVAARSGKQNRIQDDFPNWEKWVLSEKQPTLKQLEDLAKATATPLGYFFLKEPPEEKLSIPHYRTVDDQHVSGPSPNLLESVQTMERRQEWLRHYLMEQGHEPLSFVGSATIHNDPKKIAHAIRKELGLIDGWAAECLTWEIALRMLIDKVEEININVIINGIVGNNTRRKLDVAEFRGFVLVDAYAPLVFINGSDGKAAQMFTLAHELAHIWYGSSAAFDLMELHPADSEIEKACNIVAAEFLVPEAEMCDVWGKISEDEGCLQLAARHFKVSELVIARRALDLRLITKEEFFDFYQNRYIQELQQPKKNSRGDFFATQPFRVGRRFSEAVIRATLEGNLLYREAYRLTGLRGDTFKNYAISIGFGGVV